VSFTRKWSPHVFFCNYLIANVNLASGVTFFGIFSSMSNWENPVRGVSDVVEGFLSNVLDFSKNSDEDHYQNLIQEIWDSNHGTVTWKSKAKYPVIGILIPRIGIENVWCFRLTLI